MNLVDRAFDVEARNKLWVGDITYIGTGEGRPCLAAVIDAFHRKVVGWSMSGRMAEKLVTDALEQAVERESPPDDLGLVFHDDQGSQHASRAFQRCLESHGIAQSMSRPGNPWDNALAESFFKPLILRRRIAATALRIIKTPDDNSKGRVEPEDGLSPLSRIVPLGRIPNGTILRKRRAAT